MTERHGKSRVNSDFPSFFKETNCFSRFFCCNISSVYILLDYWQIPHPKKSLKRGGGGKGPIGSAKIGGRGKEVLGGPWEEKEEKEKEEEEEGRNCGG